MKAVDNLIDEHHVIKEFLSILIDAEQKIGMNQNPPREFFDMALEFARTFADKYHHFKEEYLMFSLLAQKQNGEIDAEVERLRNQHENARNLTQEISDSLDGYAKKLDTPSRRLHRNLNEYIQTLRMHIHQEEKIFFPLVEKELSEDENQRLLNDFSKYEVRAGENAYQRNKALVKEMAKLLK